MDETPARPRQHVPALLARLGGSIRSSGPALIGLTAFGLALLPQEMLNDGDTWWHLSAGDWILAHGAVPRQDPFSYTFGGQPWTAHEWLSEVLLSLAYRAGEWAGVMVLTATAFGLGAGLLARHAARDLGGLALWVLVAVGLWLFMPHLLARPHILVLPAMVAWFAGLVTARREGRAPPAWLLLVLVAWANMHGSFLAGIAMIAPVALEAWLARRAWTVATGWALFAAGAVLAGLLTPFGIEGYILPFHLMGMHNVANISEWAPMSFASLERFHVVVLIFLVFAAVLRPPISWVSWIVLIGLALATVKSERHQMLLAIVGIVLLAQPFGAVLSRPTGPAGRAAAIWVTGLAVLLAGLRLLAPVALPVTDKDPAVALAQITPEMAGQRVLNGYELSGYLIRAGIPVYVDSRADLYGDAFLDHYALMVKGDVAELEATIARHDIGWTMLTPDRAMARAMDTLPGWHRVYADAVAVIHVRDARGEPPR